MKQMQQIDNMIKTHLRLAMIDSQHVDMIVDLFAQYGDQYGKPVYIWNQRQGLRRVGFEEIAIPNTKSLVAALKFIRTSIHYGIYLMEDVPGKLPSKATAELQRIVNSNKAFHCFVALLGSQLTLDNSLKPYTLRVVCGVDRKQSQRPHQPQPDYGWPQQQQYHKVNYR